MNKRFGCVMAGVALGGLLLGCPLPGPQDSTYTCAAAGDCATGWTCDLPAGAAQGNCRKTCSGDGDCPSNTPQCLGGLCVPGGGGSSSSTGSSMDPGSSSSSSGGSSSSGSGGSSGVLSSSGGSGGSSSSGFSGPRTTLDVVTVTGGGGSVRNTTHHLQMCIGQPVAGRATAGNVNRLGLGLFSTVEAP
jgi:hypothetical protein